MNLSGLIWMDKSMPILQFWNILKHSGSFCIHFETFWNTLHTFMILRAVKKLANDLNS